MMNPESEIIRLLASIDQSLKLMLDYLAPPLVSSPDALPRVLPEIRAGDVTYAESTAPSQETVDAAREVPPHLRPDWPGGVERKDHAQGKIGMTSAPALVNHWRVPKR